MTNALAGLLIPIGIFGGLIGYPILQVLAIRRMRGGWLMLALVPLFPMGVVLGATIVGLMQGSNLWPLLLIFTAPAALVYLGVLFYLHTRHQRMADAPAGVA